MIAIVTGSTRGIGRAVAELLVALDGSVVVNGRDPAALADTVAALGADRAAGVGGSAADPAVAEALLATALERFGDVDALITCAGTAEPAGSSILSISSADWHELLDAHLTSTFETCRVVAPELVRRGGGAIVTTASHAYTGIYGGTGYPAAKGGVVSLTYALAAELREHGVRVNAVCPGARTRLSEGADYERHIDELHRRGLLDDATRMGSLDPGPPEHVAPLYAYLADPRSAPTTGEVLAGAGGYLGRFSHPDAAFVTWRPHQDHPPYTLDEVDALLRPSN